MGRIKQTYLKKAAMEIYNMHKDELTDNFEENKKIVSKCTDIESKPIRNKIAGYLTKYVKRMLKKEARKTEQSQENDQEVYQEVQNVKQE